MARLRTREYQIRYSERASQLMPTLPSSIYSYLLNTNVQLGATYKTSQISTAAYENGYKAAAGFINAQPDEVSFSTASMSQEHPFV